MTAALEHLPTDVAVVRHLSVTPELRASEGDSETLGIMSGVFSAHDVWYEVNSMWEGLFLERTADGFAEVTIRDDLDGMRVLFDHGFDSSIGNKVLGPIDVLESRAKGPYYEVPLLDTSYNRDLLPGLKRGLYGASFRMHVLGDEWDDEPKPSRHNPKGIPERTIKEMAVSEFGPVTWGAYGDATAGVRSLTDEIHFGIFRDMPSDKLVELARFWRPEMRMDSEDVGTIAQMLTLASCYVEEQDEPDELGNVAAMQSIQAALIELLPIEAAENEPDEVDEMNSSAPEGDTPESRAPLDPEAPAAATPKADLYLSRRKQPPRWLLP